MVRVRKALKLFDAAKIQADTHPLASTELHRESNNDWPPI